MRTSLTWRQPGRPTHSRRLTRNFPKRRFGLSPSRPWPGHPLQLFLGGGARQGPEDGLKDRPCAVVLVSAARARDQIVMVLPISHTPPTDPALAVEIPATTKRRLGLDDDRSWVALTEANRFIWPGPDLRPTQPGNAASIIYGALPYRLFETIRLKFIAALKARTTATVPRTT